jgi:hypothetical protein
VVLVQALAWAQLPFPQIGSRTQARDWASPAGQLGILLSSPLASHGAPIQPTTHHTEVPGP